MRLQNLIIIFVVIALPVIIILSVYVRYQVDTANLRTAYDSTFLGATYDMLSAFELNTTNNKYSTVSDSLIRDIEASINIFSDNFGSSLKLMGTNKNDVMDYVPAIVFSLHDGYYIYTPTADVDGEYDHTLRPYVYYTKEYESSDANKKIVINYSLDNYVAVYYYDKLNKSYESKAGYLEPIASSQNTYGIYISGDNVYYNGKKIDENETLHKNGYIYNLAQNKGQVQEQITQSQRAYDYYKKAYDFSNWFNNIINSANLGNSNTGRSYTNILTVTKDNQALPELESDFNNEKSQVIKNSIENDLIQAMETYKRKIGIDFAMPQFTAMDWEKIFKSTCVISFIQGLPVGTSTYNNYIILPSTENEQTINDQTLFYIGYGRDADNCYHRLGCEHLKGDTIVRIQ